MYVEITKALFNVIVTPSTRAHSRTTVKLAERIIYIVADVRILKLTNYGSSVTQYYIEDVNT